MAWVTEAWGVKKVGSFMKRRS